MEKTSSIRKNFLHRKLDLLLRTGKLLMESGGHEPHHAQHETHGGLPGTAR